MSKEKVVAFSFIMPNFFLKICVLFYTIDYKNSLELMYNMNDDTLISLRDYCYKHAHHRYKPLEYNKLIFFTEEAIAEIINVPYLYDFR